MTRGLGDPQPIRHVLSEMGSRIGLGHALEMGLLWSAWEDIAGEVVAEHSEPSSLRGSLLRVRAESPVWATEIGYLADSIKRRANTRLGSSVVEDVRVWTGLGVRRQRRKPSASSGHENDDKRGERAPREPYEALAAARAAWLRSRAGGAESPSGGAGESGKNTW